MSMLIIARKKVAVLTQQEESNKQQVSTIPFITLQEHL
jgi:hypothetical protein